MELSPSSDRRFILDPQVIFAGTAGLFARDFDWLEYDNGPSCRMRAPAEGFAASGAGSSKAMPAAVKKAMKRRRPPA
jgi:hypothetical protein